MKLPLKNLRIVSLVPSQTELLVDLGLEESIVGITKFCTHPSNLRKKKTIVGGTKTVHFEKIKKLEPTHILCNKEENTKEIVENCQKIATVHVSEVFTINDTLDLIKLYGNLFSKQNEASEIILELHSKFLEFKKFIKNKNTLNVVYFIWKKPWMIAASNTFINHLLTVNKFENVFSQLSRYPEIELEALPENLDLILLSSEPFPFQTAHITELQKLTKKTTILVDGAYFSWYGTRLIKAFDYFKALRNTIP